MDWNEVFKKLFDAVLNWASTSGVKLIIAVVFAFISFRLINFVARRINRSADTGKLDKTLARTFSYIFKIGMKLIVGICLIGYVGVDTGGIAALAVSTGAGIGLALNGALSNLAGGILIIATRPFKVDDFIEAQGYKGVVEDIHITNTKVRTGDNKVVYIPNGPLSSGNIVNYSVKETRRVDFNFSISYSEDFERAKRVVMDVCTANEHVLDDPAPMVRITEHGASSIKLVTRVWVKNADYWEAYFDILEGVKRAFDSEGIDVPFDQLDVHLKNN